MPDNRDDRPKRSWRELDQLRDKPRSRDRDRDRGGGGGGAGRSAASAAQKSYRAALERAFENGTLAELARTLSRTSEDPRPPALPPTAPPPAPPAPAAAPGTPPADTTTPAGAAPAPTPAPAAPAPEPPRDPERENRMKLLQRIREAEGKEPISRAVDAFLARYPKLPDDFEVLGKALAHRDDDRIVDALERLEQLVQREKPRRGRTLIAQLRMLEDTHGDPDVRRRAAAVRAKL
jgi:hypothetical protein